MLNETQTLILAVPGTQETREWDFQTVRDAVARGEIALDNWAWSPAQNNWIPLAQLPEFSPASYASAPSADQPQAVLVPDRQQIAPRVVVASPKVAAATPVIVAGGAVPAKRAVAVAASKKSLPGTRYSRPVEDSREFPVFKVLFTVLGLLIAGLVGVNYFLVDQPYRANMDKTPFASVPTHAHLGAFLQPNALLIHVVPNAQLNEDNFADFLSALTHSAPTKAISGISFTSFSITSAWLGQYVIGADDWKGFADFAGFSDDEKKKYVLEHLETSTGAPLFPEIGKETPSAHAAREAQAWHDLVARFQAK